MQSMFPECPVCNSKEGYKPSIFYPAIACKSCKSEWNIYPYGMELKAVSKMVVEKEFLNKKYSFDFWRDFKKFAESKPPSTNRIFAPMDLIGSVPPMSATERSHGYIIYKSEDTITYVGEGKTHEEMKIDIPTKRVNGASLKDNRWLQLGGVLVFGLIVGSALNKKSLVIDWTKPENTQQKLVFDFHDDETAARELINMLNRASFNFSRS